MPETDFRRATRSDAVELAQETFLACERVDMQALADRLGVARGTLYRWLVSREALLDELLGRMAREMYAAVREQTPGRGHERVVDAARTAMEIFAGFDPIRAFVAREPQLAVGLLMSETGGVHRELAHGTRALVLSEGATPGTELDDVVDVVVHIATSLVWVSFAIGEEPQIDRATKVAGELLRGVLPAG